MGMGARYREVREIIYMKNGIEAVIHVVEKNSSIIAGTIFGCQLTSGSISWTLKIGYSKLK
jgi:hypothetical protein